MESFIEKEQWKPGQYGPVKFYDRRRSNDKRPGCQWHATIECRDYDPKLLKAGTRKVTTQKINFYGATENAVHEKAEKFKRELAARFSDSAAISEGRTSTVAEIIDKYFTQDIATRVAPATARTYVSIGNHVKARLGPMPEDQLSTSIIKGALWEPRRKLAKEAIGYLKRALAHHNQDTKGYDNPCDRVTSVMQRGHKPNPLHVRERGAVTADQTKLLFAAVAADVQWRCFFFLLAFAGPRVGELLNARIEDFDADEGTLYVVASKTSAGIRHIVLGPKGRELLQAQIAALAARGYTGRYLFPALLGSPFAKTNFYREVFDPAMLAAGLAVAVPKGQPWRYDPSKLRTKPGIDPLFTCHWFRHTASTRERLGQSLADRPDLPKGPTPAIFIDLQLGHENEQAKFDPNAVNLPYTDADNPIGFAARRPYADRADAIVASYLPPARRLEAVPDAA